MKTAVIVPTYCRPSFLERELLNLSECSLQPDVEILVIENGPASGVEDICRANSVGGRVRYLYSPIAGRSIAVNHAIRTSDADFFIFFDDDLRVPKNIIATYVDAAQRYGRGFIFGGPLVPDAEAECPSHLLPYLPRSATGWSLGDSETQIETSRFEFFFGANWAVFRSDLLASGLFAEDLGVTAEKYSPVGEETELQHRLISVNVKAVYLPDAVIYHFVPRECYTLDWVRRRNFRLGVTDWIVTHSSEKRRREILGIPAWIIKAVVKQKTKVWISYLLNLSIEQRTLSKIRDAYLTGILHGAWTERGRSKPSLATLLK
jgi:GT2 family glycosyltransferase